MSLGCKFKVNVGLAIMMNVSTRLLRTFFSVYFVQHSATDYYTPHSLIQTARSLI